MRGSKKKHLEATGSQKVSTFGGTRGIYDYVSNNMKYFDVKEKFLDNLRKILKA